MKYSYNGNPHEFFTETQRNSIPKSHPNLATRPSFITGKWGSRETSEGDSLSTVLKVFMAEMPFLIMTTSGHWPSKTAHGHKRPTSRSGSLLSQLVSEGMPSPHSKLTLIVATWYSGSAAQSFGLNLWEVLGCQITGWVLIATIFVLNGRAGAVYHVGFPVNCRAAFGVFGAWWPTFNRAVMATVWNGVNVRGSITSTRT